MSVGKLGTGQHTYYLEQARGPISHARAVSSGVEDYYLSGAEAPGMWLGAGASALRLTGTVAIERVPAEEVVLVAGNHDQSIEAWDLRAGLRCHYLEDDGTELLGLKIWGTPWQPWFNDWAFNAPPRNGELFLASKFDLIPPDTDIVVGHGPPHGYGTARAAPAGTRTLDRRR